MKRLLIVALSLVVSLSATLPASAQDQDDTAGMDPGYPHETVDRALDEVRAVAGDAFGGIWLERDGTASPIVNIGLVEADAATKARVMALGDDGVTIVLHRFRFTEREVTSFKHTMSRVMARYPDSYVSLGPV